MQSSEQHTQTSPDSFIEQACSKAAGEQVQHLEELFADCTADSFNVTEVLMLSGFLSLLAMSLAARDLLIKTLRFVPGSLGTVNRRGRQTQLRFGEERGPVLTNGGDKMAETLVRVEWLALGVDAGESTSRTAVTR